jgi:hypothetical protein
MITTRSSSRRESGSRNSVDATNIAASADDDSLP